MNEIKFNILWLDDEPIRDYEKTSAYPFEITKVNYVDVCKEELQNNGSTYQAVILDANGLSYAAAAAAADPCRKGFLTLVDIAQKQNLPLYIYTGTIERGRKGEDDLDYLEHRGLTENYSIFKKSDGITRLLDRVCDDLEKEYVIFQEYPELLENINLYNLSSERDVIRDTLLWKKDRRKPFPKYSDLRRVVVDVICDRLLKNALHISSQLQIQKITERCMTEWEKALVFNIFKPAANDGIHGHMHDEEYMYEILANSFVLILEWYNRFRHKMEIDANPRNYYMDSPDLPTERKAVAGDKLTKSGEATKDMVNERNKIAQPIQPNFSGVVEKDDDGFYHVGEFLLKNEVGEKYLSKKVKVDNPGFFRYKKVAWRVKEVDPAPKNTLGNNPQFDKLKGLF